MTTPGIMDRRSCQVCNKSVSGTYARWYFDLSGLLVWLPYTCLRNAICCMSHETVCRAPPCLCRLRTKSCCETQSCYWIQASINSLHAAQVCLAEGLEPGKCLFQDAQDGKASTAQSDAGALLQEVRELAVVDQQVAGKEDTAGGYIRCHSSHLVVLRVAL